MSKTPRQHLADHTRASRQLELAEVCIRTLEAMNGRTADRCIKLLQAEKQRALKVLDAAAAGLGAPYGIHR